MASPAVESVLNALMGRERDLGQNPHVGPSTLLFLNKQMAPTSKTDTPAQDLGSIHQRMFLPPTFQRDLMLDRTMKMMPYPLVDPNAPSVTWPIDRLPPGNAGPVKKTI